MAKPDYKIDRIRDIGWTHWDPIGLAKHIDDWRELEWTDEYDAYLLRAFSVLWHGDNVHKATRYLLQFEAVSMGLKHNEDQQDGRHLEEVVQALRKYVQELKQAAP